jgi:hypothetical protein
LGIWRIFYEAYFADAEELEVADKRMKGKGRPCMVLNVIRYSNRDLDFWVIRFYMWTSEIAIELKQALYFFVSMITIAIDFTSEWSSRASDENGRSSSMILCRRCAEKPPKSLLSEFCAALDIQR